MAIDATLQAQVDSLLNPFPEAGERDTAFAPFSEAHQEHAAQLTEQLARVADDQGLQAALALAGTGVGDALPGAVKQAGSELVTPHPAPRGTGAVPSVEAVPPGGAPAGGAPAAAAPATPADNVIPVPNPETLPAGERALDWYREDPLAND